MLTSNTRRITAGMGLALVVMATQAPAAFADPGRGDDGGSGQTVKVTDSDGGSGGGGSSGGGGGSSGGGGGNSGGSNSGGGSGGSGNGGSGSGSGGGGGRGSSGVSFDPNYCNPAPGASCLGVNVDNGGGGGGGGDAGSDEPSIDPGEAARQAVAQLTLVATAPELSPDWNLNEWDMLAVGFPVWVSADDSSLAPLSDAESIEGLEVSLVAREPTVSVSMGDGTTLSCATSGRAFVVGSDEPGSEGPCSHAYEKTGQYTVTSTYTWQVDWEAGGQSGTIEVTDEASTEIPIGELQAVITNKEPLGGN